MDFRIYTERQIMKINRRHELIAIIENIEKHDVQIDMAKYPKDTIPYLRRAILDHQHKVMENHKKSLPELEKPILEVSSEPEPEPDIDEDEIQEIIDDDYDDSLEVEQESIEESEPMKSIIETVDVESLDNSEIEDEKVPLNKRQSDRQKRIDEKNKKLAEREEKNNPKIDYRDLPENDSKQWITKMYWKHLHRGPDQDGMATYMRHLSVVKGKNNVLRQRRNLEAAIASSPEAKRKKDL